MKRKIEISIALAIGIILVSLLVYQWQLAPPVQRAYHWSYVPAIIVEYPPSPTPVVTTTPLPLFAKTSGISWPKEDAYPRAADLRQIGAWISLDWGYKAETAQALQAVGIRYLPMQWSCSVNITSVQAFAQAFPGSYWLAFNEPDNTAQANCSPERAAQAYKLLYESVKAVDPTARLFCCGTAFYPAHIDFTAAWAQTYHDLYGNWPPVDGLQIHSYGQFADRLDAPRRKYELEQVHAWAQQQPWAANKPFIISEWAVSTASWWGDKDKGPIANYYIPTMSQWFAEQDWIIADIWFSSWYSSGYYEPDNVWYEKSSIRTTTGNAWRLTH